MVAASTVHQPDAVAPEPPADDEPITIVLPTLNERGYLADCLRSLLAQDYPHVREILVVDGGSTDGTREIATSFGPPVRLVDNPRVTAAAAMNVGIAAATTSLIVRADAHTLYAPDYVTRVLAAMRRTGAAVVGGPMRPVGTTSFGRAVAAVTSSPIGMGSGKFHYANEPQEVDTVYLGAFRREVVQAVGGYDETELQWAAEDQELNFRIRQAGGSIQLDPSITSWYFPRETPMALWRQYANYGMCKASTLKKHRTLPTWRPLAPAAMVAGTAAWMLTCVLLRRPRWAPLPLVAYTGGAGVAALRFGRDPGVAPHRALLALAICHWGYGLGFWRGISWIVRGRPFQNRPSGHR